jgi:chromosome segregation ATPase
MTLDRRALALVTSTLLLGGCATYMDARDNVRPGGRLDQQKQAAQEDLQAAKTEQTRLASEKELREAEVRRNDARIRTVQADLQRQDEALANALKSRQLTQSRHDALKREVDSIRAESRAIDLQLKSAAFKAGDAQTEAAKEKRLRDLEVRKQELEKLLAQVTSGR